MRPVEEGVLLKRRKRKIRPDRKKWQSYHDISAASLHVPLLA
jgi:hypothetical protein